MIRSAESLRHLMARYRSKHLLSYTALVAGILSLGFSPILISLSGTPGPVAAFYRVAFAAAALAIPFLIKQQRLSNMPRRGLALALLAGLFFALDTAAWATGVVLSGAVNPTLLANTAPIWVGLGAYWIFKERLHRAFWFGLAIAVTGSMLVLGLDALRSADLGLGSMLGLIAAVFYAGYFLAAQPARSHLDALRFFWLSTAAAALVLLFLVVVLRLPLLGYSLEAYAYLLALGLVTQAFGWLAINYAQGSLPASVVAPSALGQPVVVALVAGPILGEALGIGQLFGIVAVLVGVFVVHRSRLGGQKAAEESGPLKGT